MTDAGFENLLAELRPKLHRYCARMTGSVIDGEDVLQDAFVKAVRARSNAAEIAQPERWLFRIAHNAALDFLRKRSRAEARQAGEDPDMLPDAIEERPDPELLSTTLRSFMRLPRGQRSSVILMDVLGYSLAEIGDITEASVPAVKSALHRGRTRLRDIAAEPSDIAPPAFTANERELLAAYVDRFNARDYDAVRAMLADEVRLDLVNRTRLRGRTEVEKYFTNYEAAEPKHFELGFVDGRAALLAYEPSHPDVVSYFIVISWTNTNVIVIQDFFFARYAVEGAIIQTA